MAKKTGRKPLSPEKVEAVRVCIDSGVPQKDASEQTGVSIAKVYQLYARYRPRKRKDGAA